MLDYKIDIPKKHFYELNPINFAVNQRLNFQ
jgi:hypothetical protein